MSDAFSGKDTRMTVLQDTPPPARPAIPPRTRLLLEGPIVPTILQLAAPNLVLALVQIIVATGDAFFIGALGPAALAGVSLVFPVVMLMQTMSAGGMGGAVASAVARTLGAGRRDDARALVVHAIVIALASAALFTLVVVGGGRALYSALGGRGPALEAAVAYSNVVFGAAAAIWLFNMLASVIRGTGYMALPAAAMLGTGVVQLTLSPMLIHGLAGFPRLGVAGAAVATVTAYGISAVVLLGYLLSGRSPATPGWAHVHLRAPLLKDVLRVGAPGCLNNLLTNVTVVMLTGLVGPFGTFALAGYGMGARLEYLQVPLVFGFGSVLIAMVGSNVGAGNHARARRVAWIGSSIAAACAEVIGLVVALAPGLWMRLFTTAPAVLDAGSRYLLIVGPCYGFYGLALALFFSSQGAGRLLWPLLASGVRLVVAAGGGWLLTRVLGWGIEGVYLAIALSFVCNGTMLALAIRGGAWSPRRPRPVPADDRQQSPAGAR